MIFTGSNTTKGILEAIFWICLLSQPGAVQALRFVQCQSGWIQVMEGTKEVILLTCTTSNPSDVINWSNIDQEGIRRDLSTCAPTPQGCVTANKLEFNFTRSENFSNLGLLVPADRSFLYNLSFICSQDISSTPTEVFCSVDLVYPPSVPLISRNGSHELPYLEGETAYLECSINSSGNPTADLIWSGHRESYIMTNSQQLAMLQMKSLSWEDNQRNITCQAKNNYTEAKHLDIRNFTVLQVYYSPIIRFREGKDNQCVFSLDPWQCSIDNGQRLEIDCTAHSNPSPANITWRLSNTSGLILSTSASLTIIANSSAQKVTYICTVTTETTHSNDSRLPLSSVKELTVVIKGVMSDMEISTRSKSVPAIVGGTVGGLILMVMFAVIAFTFKNKRQDIVHPNAHLSMQSQEELSHESVQLGDLANAANKLETCVGSEHGLQYSTIHFTARQPNEAKKMLPEHGATQYATTDVIKQQTSANKLLTL